MDRQAGGPPATETGAGLRPRKALRLLWAAYLVTLVDVVVGGGWDAAYHATEPFDGFFSPPHVFIYTLAIVVFVLVGRLVADPAARACVPPGALILLVGGCAGVALAAPLDAIWHTAFGLDETAWSLPHAMLAQSLALLSLAFLACRDGLSWYVPTRAVTAYLAGFVAVLAGAAFLGPIGENPTIEYARRAGSQGALAADADYQHVVRMITAADLTHGNLAFPMLAALWCALTIGLLRAIDGRARYWAVTAVVVGVVLGAGAQADADGLGFTGDERVGTALPLLTAVLAFALAARLRERWRYALCGLAVGLHAAAVWGAGNGAYWLAALLGPAYAVAGGALAHRIGGVLRHPRPRPALILSAVIVLAVPLVTGLVDLALRTAVP